MIQICNLCKTNDAVINIIITTLCDQTLIHFYIYIYIRIDKCNITGYI